MRAFLSYQFGDDVSTILQILENEKVDIFNSMSDLTISKSLQNSIKNAIRDSDFVFLLYTNSSPNISFEAGIACGLNKPIFAIISPGSDSPDFLFDSTYVHAFPDEFEKINYNFGLFHSKIREKRPVSNVTKPHKFYGGGDVIITDALLKKYQEIDKNSEKDLEKYFQKLLEYFNIIAIKKEQDIGSDFTADFAIWDDSLANVLSNPILIEIKSELNSRILHDLTARFEKLSSNYLNSSWVIFYDSLKDLNPISFPSNNRLLFIKISDFLEQLRIADFSKSIRKIRNEIIHKQ